MSCAHSLRFDACAATCSLCRGARARHVTVSPRLRVILVNGRSVGRRVDPGYDKRFRQVMRNAARASRRVTRLRRRR